MPIPDPILLTTHGEPISINVRHSSRAERISIRITHEGAELVMPVGANIKKAHNFLLSREFWIRGKLRSAVIHESPCSTHIPIYGHLHEIVVCKRSVPRIESGKVFAHSTAALSIFLKEVIKLDLKECANSYCKQLGVTYDRISVRDTKGQWGSCSHAANLSFSWRLIFAPKFVMEYLVSHELCHIIEKNHGPKFWKLVGSIYPDYESAKKWLKHNGYALHRYLAS
jgi:predicted metal-dependent hydrolase